MISSVIQVNQFIKLIFENSSMEDATSENSKYNNSSQFDLKMICLLNELKYTQPGYHTVWIIPFLSQPQAISRVLTKRNLKFVISATVQYRPWKFYGIKFTITEKFQREFGRIRESTRHLKMEKMKMVNTLAISQEWIDQPGLVFGDIVSGCEVRSGEFQWRNDVLKINAFLKNPLINFNFDVFECSWMFMIISTIRVINCLFRK